MNFFERQAAARRASVRLVVLFALAVVAVVLAVDALAWVVSGGSGGALVVATVLTLATIGLGSLYRLASLGGGGEAIAAQLGGTPVAADTTDPELRRLRNVVEEVAIASGVPVPGVYVLDHEAGINAFAAGHAAADAVVAVTRGALERLNRDELQGVVAHEFAHILNGDMRLNLRLVGVLFGISMLGLIGRHVLDFGRVGLQGRGHRRGAGVAVGVMVAAAAMIAIGWVGLLFARLIRAGVSRQRERLADASAVQFTRQPAGLAGALKKIGGLPDGSVLALKSVQPVAAIVISPQVFGPPDAARYRDIAMPVLGLTGPDDSDVLGLVRELPWRQAWRRSLRCRTTGNCTSSSSA